MAKKPKATGSSKADRDPRKGPTQPTVTSSESARPTMATGATTVVPTFRECVRAIRGGVLISRETKKDKEFHFQNWFVARLARIGHFEQGGRNSYPDFRMVASTEGYELKGLAYPGRYANFDSNSQAPTGRHNGRDIYYVFGRYPKEPDGDEFPVLDLVICHGDFLNADHDYIHKNKNVKGFGCYGDLMIRDRKMYVVPTPFRLVTGTAHHLTLILPASVAPGADFVSVGDLVREEAREMVVGYSFDLRTNELTPTRVVNPGAGRKHNFTAWRLVGEPATPVKLGPPEPGVDVVDDDEVDA